jgi:hypothetical protein
LHCWATLALAGPAGPCANRPHRPGQASRTGCTRSRQRDDRSDRSRSIPCNRLAVVRGNLYDKLGFKKPYNLPIKGLGRQRSLRPNSRGAAARFLKPPFSVILPPRKQAKPCRCILSIIDTTSSCCQSHLPLHHILLDREGGVVGALYVYISQRRRHLRRWIGSRGGDG